MENPRDLTGKCALVTGASAGIGFATSVSLASSGAHVLALGRRKKNLDKLAALFPDRIQPVIFDFMSSETGPLLEVIEKKPVDILINNAGLARGRNPIQETSWQDIEEMLETNLKGLLRITGLVLPAMIQRKSGDIVNLGSIAGLDAYLGGSIYSSTKAAVHMLSKGWRLDLLGKGIRIIEIQPGMVDTEFSLTRYRGDQAKADQVYAGMRALHAEDIAEAILWSLLRPAHVNIQSMLIMPTDQGGVASVHRDH